MLHNYIIVAWRNLLKGKLYSIINVLGLAIGTAVVVLLALYVYDEWTYDTFHTKSDRIYRAWVKEHVQDEIFFNTVTPYVLGQELRDNFPEIAQVVRYTSINSQVRKGTFMEQENVHLVEPPFFKVFDFNFIEGTSDNSLGELHSAVITPEISMKYFGETAALGKTLTMQIGGEWTDFTVTGIIHEAPGNSSIRYNILIPFENTLSYMSEGGRTSWTNVNVETYVLLDPKNDVKALESKIAPFLDDKVADIYQPGEYVVGLQPLTDIHLNRDFPQGFIQVSDSRYPAILGGVALLILLLACINFTSLSIGRSIARAREVGVRKSTGASRAQIMVQFWCEALMTTAAGVVLGYVLAKLLLDPFNLLADKQLSLTINFNTISVFVGLIAVTGMLSGIYPSLVLSGFSPIKTLRGAVTKLGSDKHILLRSLVGFQFLLSILLIICTVVMTKQLQYIQDKNLGFAKEQMLILPYARSGTGLTQLLEEGGTILTRLRQALGDDPRFRQVAMATQTVGTPGWLKLGYTEQGTDKFRQFYACAVDPEMLSTIGVELTQGRDFREDAATETHSAIINAAYARDFGVAPGDPLPRPFQDYSVIGITGDFNFESLHNKVQPLVIVTEPLGLVRAASDLNYDDFPNPKFYIRISGMNPAETIAYLRQKWHEIAPEQPYAYTFLDENIDRQYRSETRLSNVISISTALALFIACLGLFGIVTLTVSQRTKEIGIRKVLGASTSQLTSLLSIDFMKIVALAMLPASCIAWYFMRSWLEDFAFRIQLEWWVFALAGVFAIVIAFFTVSIQSVRASLLNPVESLRSE